MFKHFEIVKQFFFTLILFNSNQGKKIIFDREFSCVVGYKKITVRVIQLLSKEQYYTGIE